VATVNHRWLQGKSPKETKRIMKWYKICKAKSDEELIAFLNAEGASLDAKSAALVEVTERDSIPNNRSVLFPRAKKKNA